MYEATDWGPLRLRLSEVLRGKLQEIENVLPVVSLSKIRAEICIYADLFTEDSIDIAAYHSMRGLDWLVSHSEPARKVASINIFSAQRFIDLVENSHAYPAALLHEVAHAFHDRFLDGGFENSRVLQVFRNAMAAGKYREVENITGIKRDSNVIHNQMEYFANTTTAYFLKNDDYPFNRKELLDYDPEAIILMQECWI